MTVDVTLYGPTISTFTCICAMVAAETGLGWEIIPLGSGSEEIAKHHPSFKEPRFAFWSLPIIVPPPLDRLPKGARHQSFWRQPRLLARYRNFFQQSKSLACS